MKQRRIRRSLNNNFANVFFKMQIFAFIYLGLFNNPDQQGDKITIKIFAKCEGNNLKSVISPLNVQQYLTYLIDTFNLNWCKKLSHNWH